mmetsp:Transcript_63862/g.93507  ORF Transcript_63862/g.93507 Transcript_63862/m.93507 type:complete len:156 (-) Transcript_63862:146-613(-)
MGSTDLAAARLYTASSMGNIDVVKNLVSVNGGLIRSPDEHGLHPGFTALHWCALGQPLADFEKRQRSTHLDVASFLIDEADRLSDEEQPKIMDVPDIAGDTPLHVAISWGQVELAKLMIDKGASTTAKNLLKQSPMDLATAALKAKLSTSFKPKT